MEQTVRGAASALDALGTLRCIFLGNEAIRQIVADWLVARSSPPRGLVRVDHAGPAPCTGCDGGARNQGLAANAAGGITRQALRSYR